MLALARQRAAGSGAPLLHLARCFVSLGYEAFGEDAASNLKVRLVEELGRMLSWLEGSSRLPRVLHM